MTFWMDLSFLLCFYLEAVVGRLPAPNACYLQRPFSNIAVRCQVVGDLLEAGGSQKGVYVQKKCLAWPFFCLLSRAAIRHI